ncbi:MAG TPA: deoxyribose-phosphate aldolase [Candidatus Bipolaricaulis sp.]|nr:deoxyribose-phosphate aldolase [Candidatus Bipolaricaulis sp.]MDY0392329.1 deoxyribose-phosphate aldolase [Candidatus Bipolaricaulis sp.]HPD07363.1 deoxyribose-phosphate aldolase [Candidatus Bipolaricaulis sp.]HRS14537.1 deoxyribose-phosphate aldolase [Candidatus Bipolaricaulis sp.]HRU22253.1 deoxyribose-phosphate aldolase [Candidatus Bipolaricaulis sp.]
MTKAELAKMIDHTVLGPETGRAAVRQACAEAAQHGFYAVCIPPGHAAWAKSLLRDTGVRLCTVVGFPHGQHKPEVKACEARAAVDDGADEVDMVVDVAALKEGDRSRVLADIRAVREAAPRPIVLKVILECCLLSSEQKVAGAKLAQEAGADFVKTSTGFSTGGATVEDVALLRRTVGAALGVKAAGGIRDYETALRMIQAGANRIGASKGVQILAGAPE